MPANDGNAIVAAAALDNPDLIYASATGHVFVDNDGENIVSFFIQSAGQFLPPADSAASTPMWVSVHH